MKRTAHYHNIEKGEIAVEYDDEAPCRICGEPVVAASMGGMDLCPWCDMGKCRYCGVRLVVFREEIDGGESLRELREHMKWHRERDPDHNKRLIEIHRRLDMDEGL